MASDPARWNALNESEREYLRRGLEYQEATRTCGERHVMCMAATALALTDTDPPQVEIEMPVDWKTGSYFDDSVFWVSGFVRVAVDDAGIYVGDSEAEEIPQVPASILALALRSAGWRVEPPYA